jgi:hypothetical protein
MISYQIKHNYDIGDRGVFFEFHESYKTEEVKDLAVYLQFKAEEILDDTITLDNMTVAHFFELQGAKILENRPQEFCEIDMYYDCQGRGKWYQQSFSEYDKKYGIQATEYLIEKSKGKVLAGNVI